MLDSREQVVQSLEGRESPRFPSQPTRVKKWGEI